MDKNPQPGQVYKPNGQSDASAELSDAQGEIAAIDNAMQQIPSQGPKHPGTDEAEGGLSSPASDQSDDEELTRDGFSQGIDYTNSAAMPAGPASEQQSEREDTGVTRDESSSPPEEDGPLLVWQAAEPAEASRQSKRSAFILAGVAVLLIATVVVIGGFNFGTIISILVVVTAIAAVIVSNRQHNRLEDYAIYEDRIMIGRKYYELSELQSFGLTQYGSAASIEIDPAQRFMMRLVMHLESGTADRAVDILSQKLPREDREPNFIDRISNGLKF